MQLARELAFQPAIPAAQSAKTILLVEDERLVREATCEMLRALGYSVIAAPTAAIARKIFVEHPGEINLLLCDVVLLDGDGLALASEFCVASAGLRVVIVSGYPQPAELRVFLAKPYSADALLWAIKSELEEVRRSA